jgi:CubicO group peptidase (beta-lactamase class C family)
MKKILSIILISFLISQGFAQNKKNNYVKIDSLLHEYSNSTSPGFAIVITKNGKIIYKNKIGLANIEHQISISDSSRFGIGSVSKQFTGYAILLLEQENKLSLNDDIHRYIPELPDFGYKITIRHLLKHISGLREQENLFAIQGISTADIIEQSHVIQLIENQNELNFKPGNELEYCNTGYALLATIIERITGENFRNWMKNNIFLPLEMNNTLVYDDVQEIIPNLAYPYIRYQKGQYHRGLYNLGHYGSTGLFTDINDISKWLVNFQNIKIGSKSMHDKILTETDTLNNGELIDYSYGIAVSEYKGLKVNFHGGSEAGYKAFLSLFPDHNIGIVILSNYFNLDARTLSFNIAEILLEDYLIEENKLKEKVHQVEKEITNNKSLKLDTTNYLGSYYSDELKTTYFINISRQKHIRRYLPNIRN